MQTRWSNLDEIRNEVSSIEQNNTTCGPAVMYHNNNVYVCDKEGHTLYIGESGTGKSRRGTYPTIRGIQRCGESFVVIDPKGELFRHTGCYADKYSKVYVIDFRNFSGSYNPLREPYDYYKDGDKDTAIRIIEEIASSIFILSKDSEQFWVESAKSLFIGVAIALIEIADTPDQVTIASIYNFVAQGEIRYAMSNYIKEFVDMLPQNSPSAMMLQSYVTTCAETKAGIRSTFLEGISIFARSEGLMKMLSGNDLNIHSLKGDESIAVYIIIPDETPIFNRLAAILVSQITRHFLQIAENKFEGRLPCRLHLLLEELGNIGKSIPNLPHLMSAARSRNIRIYLVLQSFSQLDNIYGISDATTIVSNISITIAFRTNHWKTLVELSQKCGETDRNLGDRISREPLITPSQLGAMETGQALVMISGRTKFITWLPDYTEMFDCSDWKMPTCDRKQNYIDVPAFDIKKYVADKKKEKMEKELGRSSNTPVSKPKIPSFGALSEKDIDSMMKDIEEELRKMDEQEELEKKNMDKKPFIFTITDCNNNLQKIARMLSFVINKSFMKIAIDLEELPYKVAVDTKHDFETVERGLKELGATFSVKKKENK